MALPLVAGVALTLRPLTRDDVETLVGAVTHPSIRPWWGNIDDLDYEREGFVNEGSAWAIEVAGQLAGWLGVNEENEPDYRHVALDVMLLPGFQDRGLGPETLRTAIRWLIDARGHHRFTIDPSLANERAVRAYAKVGFKPVGVQRSSERASDGTWRDGLLMDLLAEEIPPAST